MTEWQAVGVIITLVALVTAIVAPVTKLTTTVTRLTVLVDEMHKNFGVFNTKVEEHDDTLNNHETRLCLIEHKDHKKEGA